MYNLAELFEDTEDLWLQNAIHISSIVCGCIFLIVGLIYVALGKRLLKLCLFFTGFQFFTVAFFVLMIITSAEDANVASYTLFVSAIVGGVFYGAISVYWIKVGIYTTGFSFLAEISSIIVYFINYEHLALFLSPAIVLGICGVALTYKYMDKMIIIGSSFMGSQLFMQGVAFLASVGYFFNISLNPESEYSVGAFWGMFVASLVLTGLGIGFQLHQFDKFDYLPKDTKTAEDYIMS
jgi:hypothetical protein